MTPKEIAWDFENNVKRAVSDSSLLMAHCALLLLRSRDLRLGAVGDRLVAKALGTEVLSQRPNQTIIPILFHEMCTPPNDAAGGKDQREEIGRKTQIAV